MRISPPAEFTNQSLCCCAKVSDLAVSPPDIPSTGISRSATANPVRPARELLRQTKQSSWCVVTAWLLAPARLPVRRGRFSLAGGAASSPAAVARRPRSSWLTGLRRPHGSSSTRTEELRRRIDAIAPGNAQGDCQPSPTSARERARYWRAARWWRPLGSSTAGIRDQWW